MDKKELKKIKEKLENERGKIEKELEKFAKKDDKIEGDWDTKFPDWNKGGNNADNEIGADEVEEYSKLLALEHMLELRLKNIGAALEKIKKNKYGFCEKCGKKISQERLKIYPEAVRCPKCK